MIDFNKLTRPTTASASLDPLEIFAKTPNLKDAPNDLWKGQAEALREWHAHRNLSDVAIVLNTGAGKSIVGILIAQSLINEKIGPVVFACSTIDLVAQTARECDRIGIRYTERVGQRFSNDLYDGGQAFCITTYQALFAPISAFKGAKSPKGIIFDDAHVAERLIRDSFTLSIKKGKHPNLFDRLVQVVRPEFERVHKGPHLSYILGEVGQQSVTLSPPSTALRCREQILDALKQAKYKDNKDLFFPTVQLYEHLHHCAIFISGEEVEITPPFLPTGKFGFMNGGIRRVYLSATLEFVTDFVRGFGKKIERRIEPPNDAGNGERLILFAPELAEGVDKLQLAKFLLRKEKLLVAVPSYSKATIWNGVGVPPEREKFSEELHNFRRQRTGVFILVGRIDGIDLPQDTCRVMLIDGAPTGASLMENYLLSQLELSNFYSTKMAGRITQLLGRINRGRSDYGAFILFGKDINGWMRNERNVALLPPLIRKQAILGRSLQKDTGRSSAEEVASTIGQVLSRDRDWLKFYRDTIDGLEVSSEAMERVKERESRLSDSALAESAFMTRLWQEDLEGARIALLDVLDETALADSRLAGWYSMWLGMTYESDGDEKAAIAHYKRARSRLSRWLNVPFRSELDFDALKGSPKNSLQERLLSTSQEGAQALGNLLTKMRAQIRVLSDNSASSGQHEEALRMFAELIGFRANRPDNEFGVGPDVVWIDDEPKLVLALELKTKKGSPANYGKDDIGQAHSHLQWVADEFTDLRCEGLLVVGPMGTCSKEASPSDRIFLVETAALAKKMEEFVSKIEDTRGRTVMERWAALNELGGLPEWQIDGWFRVLATTPMKTVKKAS